MRLPSCIIQVNSIKQVTADLCKVAQCGSPDDICFATYEGAFLPEIIIYNAVANQMPMIVNTGASATQKQFCWWLLWIEQCNYNKLSGRSNVAIEGIVCSKVIDAHGQEVQPQIIPQALPCLLCLHVLINSVGGSGTFDLNTISLKLGNSVTLDALYG